MEGIAKKSGVAKGSLYNYFASKEELLKSLILEKIGEVEKMIDPDGDGMRINYAADPEHFPLDKTEQKIIGYYRNLLQT